MGDKTTACETIPLARHLLFETRDLGEARDRVEKVYCGHRLTTTEASGFRARHCRLPGHVLSLNYMEYGAETRILPQSLGSFYLFQYPLRGTADIEDGTYRYRIGRGAGGVLNPDSPIDMTWGPGCSQFLVQVDRDALNRFASTHLNLSADKGVTFNGTCDLTTSRGQGFLNLLQLVVAQAGEGVLMLGNGSLMGSRVEEAIISGLFDTHSYQGEWSEREASSQAPLSRTIRQAEAFMRERLGEPLNLEEISLAAGVSPRTLQAAFRNDRGCTPLERLREMRLESVHRELRAPTAETTVTDVAMKWGFFHLGRFAEYYRRVYGCTPVETLRDRLD